MARMLRQRGIFIDTSNSDGRHLPNINHNNWISVTLPFHMVYRSSSEIMESVICSIQSREATIGKHNLSTQGSRTVSIPFKHSNVVYDLWDDAEIAAIVVHFRTMQAMLALDRAFLFGTWNLPSLDLDDK